MHDISSFEISNNVFLISRDDVAAHDSTCGCNPVSELDKKIFQKS
jgi:hypothetical protein